MGRGLGVVVLMASWTVAATLLPSRDIVPTPWSVIFSVFDNWSSFYLPNITMTLERAGVGFLWGNAVGLGLAILIQLTPSIEETVIQLGVISQCLPIAAIGPIVYLLLGGQNTAIFLAALLVFFTTMIGVLVGLRDSSPELLDMITSFGGSKITKIRKVQIIAAFPGLITALKAAVPAAILGAVVAEYLGGVDYGIGTAMISSQRNHAPEQVWALSIIIGFISLTGYGALGWIVKRAAPWSTSEQYGP